ncbi:hypothetical protein [Microseira wollei]|nr:hypothetical protein [Microseira wollei]
MDGVAVRVFGARHSIILGEKSLVIEAVPLLGLMGLQSGVSRYGIL